MKRESEYLFAYGTLRRDAGDSRPRHLKNKTEFIGKATFQGRLYDVGGYPGVVPSDEPSERVQGEVFLVTDPKYTFRQVDEYEAYRPVNHGDGEYRREKLEVLLHSGETVNAWLYVYNLPTEGFRLIASGDYVHYLEKGR